jgi:hypothetical protein
MSFRGEGVPELKPPPRPVSRSGVSSHYYIGKGLRLPTQHASRQTATPLYLRLDVPALLLSLKHQDILRYNMIQN